MNGNEESDEIDKDKDDEDEGNWARAARQKVDEILRPRTRFYSQGSIPATGYLRADHKVIYAMRWQRFEVIYNLHLRCPRTTE